MKVTSKDVDNVATLSRLTMEGEEKAMYTRQLSDFLEYVEILEKVPTEGVEPLAHVLPLKNVFREDEVRPSLDRELALQNAPLKEDGYFKVPRILEE